MSGVEIFGNYASPPCRAVLLTAHALNVPVKLVQTLPMSPDVNRPEYIKMNPQKTVPTMNDNGFYLNESRAIMQYLCNKYGKCDTLYSKVPAERGLIDARLNFDMGTLNSRIADAYYPVIFFGQTKFEEAKLKRVDEALEFVEAYLDQGNFISGPNLTIADIACVVSLSTLAIFGHNLVPFKKVTSYVSSCKSAIGGYEEINQQGLDFLHSMVAPALATARQ